jgi:hypothetical protein
MPNGDLKSRVVALLQVTRQKTSQNKQGHDVLSNLNTTMCHFFIQGKNMMCTLLFAIDSSLDKKIIPNLA